MRRVGGVVIKILKKFLMLMDHTPPMTGKNYGNISSIFNQKITEEAETRDRTLKH